MIEQLVVQVTKNGRQHGLVEQYTNSVTYDEFKHMNPKNKEQCTKQRKEDSRIVKIKYINTKGRVDPLDVVYCKWAGDPIMKFSLLPGYVYDVPKGLVDQINDKKIPRRSGLCTVDGTDLNPLGAPLEQDQFLENEHLLVPANF